MANQRMVLLQTRDPYLWLCLVVSLAFIPVLMRLPALGDLFVHAATIEQLRQHLLAPRDPMVGAPGVGNPYFSPWAVGWALVARATGWDVFVVLRLAGMVNLGVFLIGFRAFVGSVSSNRWAPVASLLALCFLWGTRFLYWSGFMSLPTLVAGIAYPSTFAVGLMLLIWAGLARAILRPRGRRTLVMVFMLGPGGALLALVHPFTALGSGIFALALILRYRSRISWQTWATLALAATTGTAILASWPLFSIFSAATRFDGFDATHIALYRDIPGRYLLLVLAVPALIYRLRADPRDPLTWSVFTYFAIFVLGAASGHESLARIFSSLALLCHVAVGVAIAEALIPEHAWMVNGRARRLYAGIATLGLVAGALFQSGVVNLYSPGAYPSALDRLFHSRMSKGDYDWILGHVPAGSTMMTADWDARAMAPAYGVFTVQPAWPDPFLGRAEAIRIADTRVFFRPGTTAAVRARLLAKYHTQWVLVRASRNAEFKKSGQFQFVASRPPSGPREEGAGGVAELYRLVNP